MKEEVKKSLIRTLIYVVPAALVVDLIGLIFWHPLIYIIIPMILVDIALLIWLLCRKSDEELPNDGAKL